MVWGVGRGGVSFLLEEGLGRDTADDDGDDDDDEFSVSKWRILVHSGAFWCNVAEFVCLQQKGLKPVLCLQGQSASVRRQTASSE